MKPSFVKYIYKYFEKIIERFDLKKQTERDDGQSYSIEYNANTFVIRLEKYRREFYVTLYKIGHPDDEVNLFNLLQYLHKNSSEVLLAKYFVDENDINEGYRKQIEYISDTIYENFAIISDFFDSGSYESKFADITKFMIEKYPDLFGKT